LALSFGAKSEVLGARWGVSSDEFGFAAIAAIAIAKTGLRAKDIASYELPVSRKIRDRREVIGRERVFVETLRGYQILWAD